METKKETSQEEISFWKKAKNKAASVMTLRNAAYAAGAVVVVAAGVYAGKKYLNKNSAVEVVVNMTAATADVATEVAEG